MTASDKLWTVLFFALFFSLTFGCMIVAADPITPALLHTPNSIERHGIAAFLEISILFGGMSIGMLASLLTFAFLTRRFLSVEDHERWVAQLKNADPPLPFLNRQLAEFITKLCRPSRSAL